MGRMSFPTVSCLPLDKVLMSLWRSIARPCYQGVLAVYELLRVWEQSTASYLFQFLLDVQEATIDRFKLAG